MDPLTIIAPPVPTVVAATPHLNPMPAALSTFLLAAMSGRVLGATNIVGHRSMHRIGGPGDQFPGPRGARRRRARTFVRDLSETPATVADVVVSACESG
jgi:hypothetical protein